MCDHPTRTWNPSAWPPFRSCDILGPRPMTPSTVSPHSQPASSSHPSPSSRWSNRTGSGSSPGTPRYGRVAQGRGAPRLSHLQPRHLRVEQERPGRWGVADHREVPRDAARSRGHPRHPPGRGSPVHEVARIRTRRRRAPPRTSGRGPRTERANQRHRPRVRAAGSAASPYLGRETPTRNRWSRYSCSPWCSTNIRVRRPSACSPTSNCTP
jgi:hypothetical protein